MTFEKTGKIELDTACLNHTPKRGSTIIKMITEQRVKEAIENNLMCNLSKKKLLEDLGME